MIQLKSVAHYVTDKINVSELKKSEYITTDNMLPNRNGIVECEELPKAINVTKYIPGDVLISNIRPYFKKIWYSTRTSGCSNDVIVFRTNDDATNSKFLYYVLSDDAFFGYMMAGANGTKMPRGNKELIPDYLIPEFDIKKQNKIANILSNYDDLIKNSQQQIKLLEEAAQRLYKEWFIDFHFPGNENVKIVSGTPEGWEKRKIQDICIKIGAGGTPSRRKMNYWENGKIRWFKTGELLDGYLIESEEHITTDGLDNSSAKLFPKNTILMAIYASPTLGRLGILSEEACSNQAALGFISDEKQISFMWLFYKLLELRNEFNLIARGAGQQNISADVVKNTIIVKPTKDLIDKFSNWCKPVFDDILILRKNIIKLSKLRDILLPKLMSCEIEV